IGVICGTHDADLATRCHLFHRHSPIKSRDNRSWLSRLTAGIVYSMSEQTVMSARVFLGTQGWNYEGWVGPFYPRSSKTKEFLSLYANIFDTVEVDSTFYAIPAENSVKGWAERTPGNFKFSLKLPSEITHKNRLRDSQGLLEQFMQRISLLEDKLGSVLI